MKMKKEKMAIEYNFFVLDFEEKKKERFSNFILNGNNNNDNN